MTVYIITITDWNTIAEVFLHETDAKEYVKEYTTQYRNFEITKKEVKNPYPAKKDPK